MISQPTELKRMLYPHQLNAIAQLESREMNLEIVSSRNTIIYSNVGIYADITGYGKTITMVGLILRNKRVFVESVDEPYVCERITHSHGYGNVIKKQISRFQRLDTTLILVNQNILKQWVLEFSFTPTLQIAVVTNKKLCEQIDPMNYDVVLCSSTMYNHFLSRFPDYAWKRFIFDEPVFTKVPSMRNIVAGYHWLVTATPENLLYAHQKSNPSTYLGALFSGYVEYNVFKQLIFKNDDDYVRDSVKLPSITHLHYQCPETITQILKDIIPNDISQMISAGNVEGAIRLLGGTSSSNLIELIRMEKQDLMKEADMKIKRHSRMGDEVKVRKWQERREILENELECLETRLSHLTGKEVCHICLECVKEPVISKCCYQAYCGSCILKWLGGNSKCPLCRESTPPSGLIYLSSKKQETNIVLPIGMLTKMETIRKIYDERKDGKFVIFSMFDETFDLVYDLFQEEKIFQLKGKKMETRHRILEHFKNTKESGAILFLNSIVDGVGLNLQEATDIILFHEMTEDVSIQVIGRCHRMGRVVPLTVHHLHS